MFLQKVDSKVSNFKNTLRSRKQEVWLSCFHKKSNFKPNSNHYLMMYIQFVRYSVLLKYFGNGLSDFTLNGSILVSRNCKFQKNRNYFPEKSVSLFIKPSSFYFAVFETNNILHYKQFCNDSFMEPFGSLLNIMPY